MLKTWLIDTVESTRREAMLPRHSEYAMQALQIYAYGLSRPRFKPQNPKQCQCDCLLQTPD